MSGGMTEQEMLALLGVIAAHDGRTWKDDTALLATAKGWHECVGHLVTYEAACRRVTEWYRNKRERMMPADLRRLDVPQCLDCWRFHYDEDLCWDDPRRAIGDGRPQLEREAGGTADG